MKITKLEHSGVVIEEQGQVLVFDPVEFKEKLPELTGVVGMVITHGHGDHCQPEQIARIVTKNPGIKIWTTEDTAEGLRRDLEAILGDAKDENEIATEMGSDEVDENSGKDFEILVAKPGERAKIGEFELEFFGGEHAAIIPGVIPCQNVGVVVNGKLVNPGDSFDVSGVRTEGTILLTPIAAPWCKVSEVADFVEQARPAVVIPVHDAVLSELGLGYTCAHIANVCGQIGAKFVELKPGESFETE